MEQRLSQGKKKNVPSLREDSSFRRTASHISKSAEVKDVVRRKEKGSCLVGGKVACGFNAS